MLETIKQEALQMLGEQYNDMRQRAQAIHATDDASAAMHMMATAVLNAMEEAYFKLDKMLYPIRPVCDEPIDAAAGAFQMPVSVLQEIVRKAVWADVKQVVLFDDGASFTALGCLNKEDVRQLFTSESVLL